MSRKWMHIVVLAVLVIPLILTACGPTEEPAQPEAPTAAPEPTEAPTEEAAVQPTEPAEPAEAEPCAPAAEGPLAGGK